MPSRVVISTAKRSAVHVEKLLSGSFEIGVESRKFSDNSIESAIGFFTREEMIAIRDNINLELGE